MAMNNFTSAINGELRAGDTVVSTDVIGFSYLAGVVRAIDKLGSPEHGTENETDDVHVDFTALEYTPRRVNEIEEAFAKIYGEYKPFDELPLDDVIMPPAALIRTNHLTSVEMDEFLNSGKGAKALCDRILFAQNEKHTEILYSPLKFYIHDFREEEENGELGLVDLFDERYRHPNDSITHEQLGGIEGEILRDRERMDSALGMAEYLPDELRAKISSIFPSIEFAGDDYYCVTKMELTAPLTSAEMSALKEWWSGQLSDGWGEGLEQREIKDGSETLYVVPWSSKEGEFFVDTQTEFDLRMGIGATIKERDPAIATFINREGVVDQICPTDHGFAKCAIKGLITFATEIAEKNSVGWGDSVLESRNMVLAISDYMNLEAGVAYGELFNDWSARFDFEIKKALDPSTINSESENSVREQGIRGLAWFACEMGDKDKKGLAPHIISTQALMQRMSDFWRFDSSLCNELNILIMEAIGAEAKTEQKADDPMQQSPAQKALMEPSFKEDAETENLHGQLINVIDDIFVGYIESVKGTDANSIADKSTNIAAMAYAHFYMTEMHNFRKSELEYLLQFQNPLEVLASVFENEFCNEQRSDITWNFFHEQEALKSGHHALIADSNEPTLDQKVEQLRERFSENYNEFYLHWNTKRPATEIFAHSQEISLTKFAHEYMTNIHDFEMSEVDFLLKFQNPLQVVTDHWAFDHDLDEREIAETFFKQMGSIESRNRYALAETAPPASEQINGKEAPPFEAVKTENGFTSVMGSIRRGNEDRRNNPPTKKEPDNNTRTAKDEEL